MAEIIPAILEKDFGEIKNKLTALREQSRCVHLDIEDGIFVPAQTWPFSAKATKGAALLDNDLDPDFLKIVNEEEGLPFWDEFDFELDLMVADAVENFDLYLKLGAKRIIFHPKIGKDLEEFEHFLESLDMYVRDNVEIGIAFLPSHDLSVVARLSHKADFLHAMGSDKIGFQGEKFSEKVLENIKFLKKELPGIVISVDIGITLENAEEILKAGADRLIIGSAIWKSGDPIGTLQMFQDLV
jgi:ribulose-phosphate 3-epimerase